MNDIIKQLNAIVRDFSAKKKNIGPALDTARSMIEVFLSKNFSNYGRWDGSGTNIFSGGSQRWKPLAKSTKAKYNSLGYELVATLNRNGALLNSIGTQVYGKSGIIITANSPYAQIHQEGGTINHPGGTPYITVAEGLARFISKKKVKNDKYKGQKVKYTKPHKITIPARPFITLTPEDFQQLVDFISDFQIK